MFIILKLRPTGHEKNKTNIQKYNLKEIHKKIKRYKTTTTTTGTKPNLVAS